MTHIFYVTLKPSDEDRAGIAEALNFVAPVTSLHPMHIGLGNTGYCLEPDGMTEEQIDAVARAANPLVDTSETGAESVKDAIRQRGLWILAKWCEPMKEHA